MNKLINHKYRKNINKIANFLSVLFLAIIFITPLVMMISTSFKTLEEAFSGTFSVIPKHPTLENYEGAFTVIPYFRYLWNTFFISICCLAGQLLVTPMIAYSISKIKWKGSKIILALVLATMMLPYFAIMVPLYKIWASIGLTGTKWPLILCSLFGNSFYIIIMRQFFLSIPNSLLEAAKIDGCNEFQRYLNIVLPLTKPALSTIAIFTFLYNWSDYLGPMLYINNEADYTLSIGLKAFMNQYTVEWTMLMAAATIFIIPVILLFIVFQKNFIEGISITGLK